MNCRTFHKNLEDYLQDGLDYPGRFGMERHAEQCIGCGKDMADAQELRRKVSELVRVKAPAGFESALLDKIRTCKTQDRCSAIRRFWFYGMEWPSAKNFALASSGLIILALGFVSSFRMTRPPEPPASPLVVAAPAKPDAIVKTQTAAPAPDVAAPVHSPVSAAATPKDTGAVSGRHRSLPMQLTTQILNTSAPARFSTVAQRDSLENPEAQEVEYIEITVTWPGNNPVPVRSLSRPKLIRVQYRPDQPEDYFIQNVSH